jgi:hypothetical protein
MHIDSGRLAPARLLRSPGFLALLLLIPFYLFYSRSTETPFSVFEVRWDAVHYLSIAKRGYELNPCPEAWQRHGITICGNIWFPMWPYVNRVVGWLFPWGIETTFRVTAILVTYVCFWLIGRFAAVFKNAPVAGTPDTVQPWMASLLLASVPGSFYFLTAFPFAFVIALSLVYCGLFYATRVPSLISEALLFAIAVAIGMSYPTAPVLAVIPCGFVLLNRASRVPRRLVLCAWYVLPFVLGIAAVCAILYFQFGDFWLYFKHQLQPNFRHAGNPLTILWQVFADGQTDEVLTLTWFLLGAAVFARWPPRIRVEAGVLVLAVILLTVATGGAVSMFRRSLLAFPIAYLVAYSERPLWLKGTYALSGILINVLWLFPRYIHGILV